ncbi:hypothetical protein D8674_034807 [Pyrus ussuriensis x Pyrus communis]|uniref:Uncharacterized protein n=1 Tax=Pyrus ussuriensis x Pyrus communis TaxID=2448454 RepID=A0A5N5GFC7_9ROSA|nr:hypothetical protein D8674_034807 [Pyrus ussuriensis x Pyrus communis]
MAPKVARTQSSCETSEGISTMRRLLNGLHCLWIDNGIYELIMLSKSTVIVKPELLTTALLFWNSGTNTFDFRMGLMSLTILGMVQATPIKKRTRAHVAKSSKFSTSLAEAGVGPQATKKPTVVSREEPLGAKFSTSIPSTSPPLAVASAYQFDPSIGEMLYFVEQDNNLVIPEIPVVSEVTNPQASLHPATITEKLPPPAEGHVQAIGEGSGFTPALQVNDPLQSPKETTPPPPSSKGLGEISGRSPPLLIRTKLRSSGHPLSLNNFKINVRSSKHRCRGTSMLLLALRVFKRLRRP